jgi:hypothetical protein
VVAVERITGRSNGPDQIRPRPGIQRLPEAPDVDVDGPCIDIGIVAPDRLEQSFPGKNAAGMLKEMPE